MTETVATPSMADRLDALFEPWNRSDAPGVVVGVARNGKTLYRRGFGMASLESASANHPGTRMRIGSTSKHFAALLILLLAEDGLVALDAPIGLSIPELQGTVGAPTIRQLMLHRGGGRDDVDLAFLTHGFHPRPAGATLLVQARQTAQNFAPGEAMIYNNGGYHLLSIAAERAGGAPFEQLLATRLFEPLGLDDTVSWPGDHDILPGMATLHMPGDDGTWRRGLLMSEEVKGEGAIVSTIDDMLRWAAHLRTREHFGSEETWRTLFTPAQGADTASGAYAAGLQLADYRGLRTVSHSGGVVGGSCEMLTLPDQALEIVIMANGAPGANPSELALRVVDLLMEGELGPHAPMPAAADHAAWLGEWWSPGTGMVYGLVAQDGALKVEVCSQPYGMDLRQTADGRVLLPEAGVGDLEFLFDRSDAAGLDIRFGTAIHRYQRLDRTTVDAEAFQRAVLGRYGNADTEATATFFLREGRLMVSFADGLGSTEGPVTPLGSDVAGLGPIASIYWCVVSLERKAGQVAGFRLDAMRTRGLRFERI